MRKRILMTLLGVSLVLELYLTVRSFLDPQWLQLALEGSSEFQPVMASVISWFLLFVSGAAALAMIALRRSNPFGLWLSSLLGIWWIAIGLGLWLQFSITTNLVTDSLKGLLIFLATLAYSREASAKH